MFFDSLTDGFLLRVKLQPNASSIKVLGTFLTPEGSEYLKISVISVPENGKANQELINWLSKNIGLSKSSFEITSGQFDRLKKIHIKTKDLSIEDRIQCLLHLKDKK